LRHIIARFLASHQRHLPEVPEGTHAHFDDFSPSYIAVKLFTCPTINDRPQQRTHRSHCFFLPAEIRKWLFGVMWVTGEEGVTPLEISGCYLIRSQSIEELKVRLGEPW
jgi:hypothetical protein